MLQMPNPSYWSLLCNSLRAMPCPSWSLWLNSADTSWYLIAPLAASTKSWDDLNKKAHSITPQWENLWLSPLVELSLNLWWVTWAPAGPSTHSFCSLSSWHYCSHLRSDPSQFSSACPIYKNKLMKEAALLITIFLAHDFVFVINSHLLPK
jgi:hypothetical protein